MKYLNGIGYIPRIYLIFLFIIILITFYPLLSVGLVINDDLQASLLAYKQGFLGFFSQFTSAWEVQGRANLFASVAYFIPFAFDNFYYFRAVTLGTLFLNLLLIAYILRGLIGQKEVFYIALLIAVIGLQNSWEHTPVSSFPGFFTIPICMFIMSLVFFDKFVLNNKKVFLGFSLICLLCSLFSYELFVLYTPFFFILSFYRNKNLRKAIKLIFPVIISVLLYLIIYVIFRLVFGSSYGGVQPQGSLNLIDALKVIWQFSISSIPGYFVFNDKYRYLMYIYSDSLSLDFNKLFITFLTSIKIQWVVKGLLVFILMYHLLYKVIRINISKIILGTFGLYIFIPPVLLSITQLYQDAVIKNNQLGMPVSYFSYLSFIVFSTLFILYINGQIKLPVLRKIFVIAISFFIAIVGVIVDFTNDSISRYQVMSNYKWQTIDRLIDTAEFQSLPDSSVIYAPSLWSQIGSVGIHDNYWTDYINYKSGKKVLVIKDLSQIDQSLNDIFFLKYTQDLKINEQYIVFSKVENTIDELLSSANIKSDIATVYAFTKYNDFTILGQYENHLNLNNNNKTTELFVFRVDNSKFVLENDLKKVQIKEDDMLLESIFSVNGTNNEIKLILNDKIEPKL